MEKIIVNIPEKKVRTAPTIWNFQILGVFPKLHKSNVSDISGFQNQQKSCLQWESNSQHEPYMDWNSNALPTQPICQSLLVSDFQTLIKSCSIEFRNDLSPKGEVEHETKVSL